MPSACGHRVCTDCQWKGCDTVIGGRTCARMAHSCHQCLIAANFQVEPLLQCNACKDSRHCNECVEASTGEVQEGEDGVIFCCECCDSIMCQPCQEKSRCQNCKCVAMSCCQPDEWRMACDECDELRLYCTSCSDDGVGWTACDKCDGKVCRSCASESSECESCQSVLCGACARDDPSAISWHPACSRRCGDCGQDMIRGVNELELCCASRHAICALCIARRGLRDAARLQPSILGHLQRSPRMIDLASVAPSAASGAAPTAESSADAVAPARRLRQLQLLHVWPSACLAQWVAKAEALGAQTISSTISYILCSQTMADNLVDNLAQVRSVAHAFRLIVGHSTATLIAGKEYLSRFACGESEPPPRVKSSFDCVATECCL